MSNTTPSRVTVVTPTYNRADLLPATIDSILAQTLEGVRYIVVDDGSTDDTAGVVARYGDAVEYLHHANRGEAASTNRGWLACDSEYFAMVSSDDPMLPHWLERAVAFMDARPDVIVGYPDWEMIDLDGAVIEHIEVHEYAPERLLGWLHCLPGPGTIIRRSAFPRDFALRSPAYRYVSDLQSWIRLSQHGPFARIPETLATWRLHPESTSIGDRSLRRAMETIAMVRAEYGPDAPDEVRRHRRMALSRALYLASVFVRDTHPLMAAWYFARSRLVMWRDPADLPAALRRVSPTGALRLGLARLLRRA